MAWVEETIIVNARTLHDVGEVIGKMAARFDALARRRKDSKEPGQSKQQQRILEKAAWEATGARSAVDLAIQSMDRLDKIPGIVESGDLAKGSRVNAFVSQWIETAIAKRSGRNADSSPQDRALANAMQASKTLESAISSGDVKKAQSSVKSMQASLHALKNAMTALD